MKTSTKFYLSLFAGISLGMGVSLSLGAFATTVVKPSLYAKEVVEIDDGLYGSSVIIFEDRKRNQVCYITYTNGTSDRAISCVRDTPR